MANGNENRKAIEITEHAWLRDVVMTVIRIRQSKGDSDNGNKSLK